jgi:hypothetical protein
VSGHESVAGIVQNERATTAEAVHALREERVLAGLKIVDLGCGPLPGFALAAKAMGAEVHTADVERPEPALEGQLDSHTIIDLNDLTAPEILRQVTGGDLDLATENIIAQIPGHSLAPPLRSTLHVVGLTILRNGGFFYHGGDFSSKRIQPKECDRKAVPGQTTRRND